MLLLCASLEQPWSIISSLKTWAEVIEQRIKEINDNEPGTLKEAQERRACFF